MEAKFELTSIDKNTISYDLGGGALAAESSFYAAGYGDFIAIEHHTMKHFGTRQVPVSGVTVNGVTFATDTDAVAAINALDIFPDGQKIVASDPRVDGILSVVPATATPDNKLVDRATLNSSISSMAAERIEYDTNGSAFPTKAALLSATTVYNKGSAYIPKAKDYLSISADESAPPPFTNGQTRYIYDGAVYAYDMGVNEEPFTADEVAAIESGITSEKVEQYDAALAGDVPIRYAGTITDISSTPFYTYPKFTATAISADTTALTLSFASTSGAALNYKGMSLLRQNTGAVIGSTFSNAGSLSFANPGTFMYKGVLTVDGISLPLTVSAVYSAGWLISITY